MQKITILCVGKLKEKFYADAAAEYIKRLSRYCKLEIIEVADEKTPDGASAAIEEQIKEKEKELQELAQAEATDEDYTAVKEMEERIAAK